MFPLALCFFVFLSLSSLCLSLCVCPPFQLSVYLSLSLSTFFSIDVCLSLYVCLWLRVCPSDKLYSVFKQCLYFEKNPFFKKLMICNYLGFLCLVLFFCHPLPLKKKKKKKKDNDHSNWFCGVVVITSALHAEGREFEPRQNLIFLGPE